MKTMGKKSSTAQFRRRRKKMVTGLPEKREASIKRSRKPIVRKDQRKQSKAPHEGKKKKKTKHQHKVGEPKCRQTARGARRQGNIGTRQGDDPYPANRRGVWDNMGTKKTLG